MEFTVTKKGLQVFAYNGINVIKHKIQGYHGTWKLVKYLQSEFFNKHMVI